MALALCAGGVVVLAALVLLGLPHPAPLPPIRAAIEILRPPEAVFAFATTPSNWPKWYPTTLSVAGETDHSLEVGERLIEYHLVAGIRYRHAWTVVEREAPMRWRIEGRGWLGDEAWITYMLTPVPMGTRFERELVYRMPNWFLSWLVARFIHGRTEQAGTLALSRLKAELESKGPR